jgi:hypothetical protein
MAVVSDNDVWAVGSDAGKTLTMHWDGARWARISSPNPEGSYGAELDGIAALSGNNVWAVGRYSGKFDNQESMTLVLHWDGKSWTQVPSPSVPSATSDTYNYLNGVAAVSNNDVWAVGAYSENGSVAGRTLILHWDGRSWTQFPSPNAEGEARALYAIAAVSANDIWAVGSANLQSLVLHWDGKSWSRVPSPGGPRPVTYAPYDIVALSSSNVWVSGPGQTLHWDGAAWHAVPASNVINEDSALFGISARSGDEVWVMGSSGGVLLVARWDGNQWSRAPYPDNQGEYRDPFGTVAVSGHGVWIAGGAGPKGRTLLTRFLPGQCASP